MQNTSSFKPVRKAVFPIAGLGTRFLPATKVMPKEMLPLNDRPLIQHAFEEAREAGIEEFVFVTGRQKEMIEEHFDHQPELMRTLEQRGKDDMIDKVRTSEMSEAQLFCTRQANPLGLGHAIWCAKKLIGDEPFAIILPDDVIHWERGCLAQMMDAYNEHGGNVVAVKDVPREETYKYGIIDPASDNGKTVDIQGLVEKPDIDKAPSTLCVIGRYILQPEVFNYLSAFEKGTGGEIQLTDSMAKLIGNQPFNGLRFEGDHFDCGGRNGFIKANITYALKDPSLRDDIKSYIESIL
mgnify:CR=1 FL=1